MQFRSYSALLVFLGSYFPLALILALQDVSLSTWRAGFCASLEGCSQPKFNHPIASAFGVALTGVCLALTLVLLRQLRYKYPVTILESRPLPSELISYSFPYIVSFMGVDFNSPGKVAGLLAFLAWLFLITYRAGQIIMNPVLLVFGWSLYEAKADINGNQRIIKILFHGKHNPIPGTYLCQVVQGSFVSDGSQQ